MGDGGWGMGDGGWRREAVAHVSISQQVVALSRVGNPSLETMLR